MSGYPIRELVDFSPEDIIYLLFNKELPTWNNPLNSNLTYHLELQFHLN